MRWLFWQTLSEELNSVILGLIFWPIQNQRSTWDLRLNGSYCHIYFISWLHSLRLQIGFLKAAVFNQVIVWLNQWVFKFSAKVPTLSSINQSSLPVHYEAIIYKIFKVCLFHNIVSYVFLSEIFYCLPSLLKYLLIWICQLSCSFCLFLCS